MGRSQLDGRKVEKNRHLPAIQLVFFSLLESYITDVKASQGSDRKQSINKSLRTPLPSGVRRSDVFQHPKTGG
jgi:hypothetical protein